MSGYDVFETIKENMNKSAMGHMFHDDTLAVGTVVVCNGGLFRIEEIIDGKYYRIGSLVVSPGEVHKADHRDINNVLKGGLR